MKLDLNSAGDFTAENVQRLIGSNPSARSGIVVRRDGIAYVSPDVPPTERVGFYIPLAGVAPGSADAGPDADVERARRVLACLKNNWPVPRDVYL